MADSFLLIGIVKTDDGLRVIDPTQKEHSCANAEELFAVVEKLMQDEEIPQVETEKASHVSSRRRAREVQEFEESLERVSAGISAHVSETYGETLGGHAGNAVLRGSKGLTRFLRRISRP